MGTGDRPLAMANLRTFGLRVVLNRTNYVFPEEAAFEDLYRGFESSTTLPTRKRSRSLTCSEEAFHPDGGQDPEVYWILPMGIASLDA